jgi:hypothetical protein
VLTSRSFARTKWFDHVSKFIKSKESPALSVEFNLVDGSALVVGRIWTEDEHVRLEVHEQGGEMSLRFVPYERIAQITVRRHADKDACLSFTLTEETH